LRVYRLGHFQRKGASERQAVAAQNIATERFMFAIDELTEHHRQIKDFAWMGCVP